MSVLAYPAAPDRGAARSFARGVLLMAAGVAAAAGLATALSAFQPARPHDLTALPDLVGIAPGTFAYREAGEFLRDGNPVDAPLTAVTLRSPPAFMKRQVSRAEYDHCVEAGACRPLAVPAGQDPARTPATGLNWHDATAYAAWLSAKTGEHFRLPTDAEWAYAAGSVFRDDAVGAASVADPSKRWIAAYERESAETAASDPRPLPFGSFGVNANGLQDFGGNVWEWTDSCYRRRASMAGGAATTIESCGVRVVEGRHRTYLSDFVRDARGGACSAGVPPANLGVRLVRDPG